MPFPLTDEQRGAVENRGGSLLVSAAAGSGKTRVLVERLLSYVDGEGENIDAFPVITYTRAAAAELRSRIGAELSARVAVQPGNAHLRRQMTRLYGANISTIHALCGQLLREFGYRIGVDADFRMCTEDEAAVLRMQVLNDLLEERYETIETDEELSAVVDTMGAGRDDRRLLEIVFDIYDKVQSHPDPERWMDEQERAFFPPEGTDAGETAWGAFLLRDAEKTAAYWLERINKARTVAGRDPVLEANYGHSLEETADGLRRLKNAAGESWDKAREALPIPFPTAGRKRGVEDEEAAEQVKSVRNLCKKQLDKLGERFDAGSEELMDDLRAVYPAVKGLFRLVRDFGAAYRKEKARRGMMDFADLEHETVCLLTEGEDHHPNALADEISLRWREVMVDEYQDTNEVQNAIFYALSHRGEKLFMVGDVKQSIYRFRLADPTIFLKKYRSFPTAEKAKKGEPRRMVLSRNFRSRPEVLEAANFLLRCLMSEEMGEMEYTDEDALYPGGEFPEGDDVRTELYLLDREKKESDGDEERPDKSLAEARFAAGRIRALLDEGFRVREGGTLRAMRPSDAAILLRSPSVVLPYFTRALDEQGIPWRAEQGEDFFGSTEVSTALSLLQIVDNPRQDVPLIAALRSPVYGFSGDRLALLRAGEKKGDFYSAVERAAEEGDTECRRFLEELSALRRDCGERKTHELLWRIYEETNLVGLCAALGDGRRRKENLTALYELARSCEESGNGGLFGFLTYLDRMRKAGGTLPGLRQGKSEGVTIMSIHRSKGLEFPVVLLCGMAKRMNREDMQKPILFHPKLGVGPKRLDRARMLQSPTIARTAVALQLEREMMAEELRLLYVAMTRAQDKLILTAAPGKGTKALSALTDEWDLPVSPRTLMSCESVGQWVLRAALCRPDGEALREAAGRPGLHGESAVPFGPEWRIEVVDGTPLEQAPERRKAEAAEERRGSALPEEETLTARFRWRYGHEAAADTPSKLTATQLKGREKDEETAEETARPPQPMETGSSLFRRPRFAEEEMGLTAAQKGTAQHLAMQFLDFDQTDSLDALRAEIERLRRKRFLTDEQAEAVKPEQLLAFFQSDIGRKLKNAKELHREFKFSLLSDAAEYYGPALAGEEVLLQGVIDCWFEDEDGITVLDFKTDRVNEKTVLARAEEYRPQVETYCTALQRMTGKPVRDRVLWFFALSRAVTLEGTKK